MQQDGHLLLLCKPHSLPKHGEGELGQGLGIVLGMFRNVRFAVLPVRAYGAIHWVAFGFGPAEDGDLIGPPRQLVQFLQFLPQPTQGTNYGLGVSGQGRLEHKAV